MLRSIRTSPLFVVLSLLYAAIAFFTPPLVDDLIFMGDSCGIGIGFEKLALGWEELLAHFIYDVGRLSNVIAVVLLCLLPHFVFAILQAVAVYIILEFGSRLIGITSRIARTLYATIVVFALPWHDSIAVLDYSVNYVWSTALIVLFLYAFFRHHANGTDIGWLILALAAGWMHESFSLPVCVGLACTSIYNHRHISRRHIALAVFFAIGTALNFVFPAIWHRASMTHSSLVSNVAPIKLAMTCFAWVAPIFALAARKRTCDKALMATLAISTAAAFMIYLYAGILRGMWICQFYGILTVLMAIHAFHIRIPRIVPRVFIPAATLVLVVSLSWSVYWCMKFDKEYKLITEEVMRLKTDHLYRHTLSMPVRDQIITFGRVKSDHFRSKMDLEMFGRYYCDGSMFKVLPPQLEHTDMSEFSELPANPGIYTDGHLVVSRPESAGPYMRNGYISAVVEFSDGTHATRSIVPQPFTDINGNEWVLLVMPRRYGTDTSAVTALHLSLIHI